MYAYIRGKLAEKSTGHAIIDANGVGYKILIPITAYGTLPSSGSEVSLFTSWVVREQSQTLFGFTTTQERDLFEILITISGIGPKTALSLIGHLDYPALEEAVRKGDAQAFVKVPGIGKKTADRLIIDLRGRLNLPSLPSRLSSGGKLQDALQALMNLGYSQAAAERALHKALDSVGEEDLSRLISEALKSK